MCVRCGSEIEDFAFCPYCGKRQPQTPPAAKPKRKKRPNGTGSIVRLKKKGLRRPWRATIKGLTIGYYATQREAQEALSRLVDAEITDKFNWTFKQVYEAWKAEHFQEVGATTVVNYERAYAVSERLHEKRFRALRSSDFQEVINDHRDLATNTLDKYKQLYTQMSAWAIDNDIATKNYASRVQVNGREAVKRNPLTADEIESIKKDGSETARVVLMMLSTGLRINELFSLPLADYKGKYVIGGEKSAAGRNRVVPIRPEGREHFAYFAAKAQERGATLLIEGYDGQHRPENWRKRDYYPLLDRLGIDRSKVPHTLRTTYGTRAATQDNLAPAVLQKVMGHSDFNTTQKYYNHPDAEALISAVEKSIDKN